MTAWNETETDQRVLVLLAVGLFLAGLCLVDRADSKVVAPSRSPSSYVWLAGNALTTEGLYQLRLPTSESDTPWADFSLPPNIAPLFFRPIAVNRSSGEVLTFLPGVGDRLAERIIIARQKSGGIKNEAELAGVTGFNHRKLQMLRPLLSYE